MERELREPNASDNQDPKAERSGSACRSAPLSKAAARAREKRLAVEAKAHELGLTPPRFKAKLKKLLQLLPDVKQSTLLSLEAEDLQDLMCNTPAVAARVVEATSRLSVGFPRKRGHKHTGVAKYLWEHLGLLSSSHWHSFISSIPVASLLGLTGSVLAVAITPDSCQAVSGSEDHTLWDLQQYTCTATLPVHGSFVRCVAITPDGRQAVTNRGSTLRLWDMQSYTCTKALPRPQFVMVLALTADGSCAVTGSLEGTLGLWDLKTHSCVATLQRSAGRCVDPGVTSVAVSPDGRTAVAGTADNSVSIWNLQAQTWVGELQGHSKGVTSVAISPDGRQAVSGSADQTLRVWDLQARTCTATLAGHADKVQAVAATPDGRHAVSGSLDNTLRVWDLQALACVATLRGHTAGVLSVAIAPDGRHAVSGSKDGTLLVWDLQPHTGSGGTSFPAP